MSQPKALVVLSGGQDSSTCLFWAVDRYGSDNVHAVTFDYDQRHRVELAAAVNVAKLAGVAHHEIVLVGSILAGSSPLTNKDAVLERYDSYEEMDKVIGDRVEKTFVPMRNALFLTLAANRAAVLGTRTIITGVCQADNANYPDCTQDFILAQECAINNALGLPSYGSLGGVSIETPLMDMSKAVSVRFAMEIRGAYSALAYTHTAYDGQFPPTGSDHASVLRAHGFEEADWPDPLVLRAWKLGAMTLPKTPNYRSERVYDAFKRISEELRFSGMVRWWNL
jgi:7-cyano-7-deazaguanine synthase